MQLKIKGTAVLQKNLEAKTRLVVNQGGSRSSKTYSIAQMFIIQLLKARGKVLTICRKTLPSLKITVMRDFFDILKGLNLYKQELHNKSEYTYKLNGNLVEFLSLDQPQKKRGAKRNYLWMNETNEFTYEDYMQMNMRTSERVFLDYNPSDEFSFIYSKIIPRKDCTFIHSTYKDNPFLEESLVYEIELLKEMDEDYWKIYGLGIKGKSGILIFDNWDEVDEFPEQVDEIVYGMDFGYNNPSVILKIGIKDQRHAYIDELLYERKLTNTMLIEKMELLNIGADEIKADSAEPDRIEEISQAGFNVFPCRKGKNSVKDSIDVVKRFMLHITKRSVNTLREIKAYKWRKDKDGNILEEPVKFRDHSMASIRYGIGDNEGVLTFLEKSVQGADRDMTGMKEEVEVSVEIATGVGADRDTREQEW